MKALKEKRVSFRSLMRGGLVILSILTLAFAYVACGGSNGSSTDPTTGTTSGSEGTTPGGDVTQPTTAAKYVTRLIVQKHPQNYSYQGMAPVLTGMEVYVEYNQGASEVIKGDDIATYLYVSPPIANFASPSTGPLPSLRNAPATGQFERERFTINHVNSRVAAEPILIPWVRPWISAGVNIGPQLGGQTTVGKELYEDIGVNDDTLTLEAVYDRVLWQDDGTTLGGDAETANDGVNDYDEGSAIRGVAVTAGDWYTANEVTAEDPSDEDVLIDFTDSGWGNADPGDDPVVETTAVADFKAQGVDPRNYKFEIELATPRMSIGFLEDASRWTIDEDNKLATYTVTTNNGVVMAANDGSLGNVPDAGLAYAVGGPVWTVSFSFDRMYIVDRFDYIEGSATFPKWTVDTEIPTNWVDELTAMGARFRISYYGTTETREIDMYQYKDAIDKINPNSNVDALINADKTAGSDSIPDGRAACYPEVSESAYKIGRGATSGQPNAAQDFANASAQDENFVINLQYYNRNITETGVAGGNAKYNKEANQAQIIIPGANIWTYREIGYRRLPASVNDFDPQVRWPWINQSGSALAANVNPRWDDLSTIEMVRKLGEYWEVFWIYENPQNPSDPVVEVPLKVSTTGIKASPGNQPAAGADYATDEDGWNLVDNVAVSSLVGAAAQVEAQETLEVELQIPQPAHLYKEWSTAGTGLPAYVNTPNAYTGPRPYESITFPFIVMP